MSASPAPIPGPRQVLPRTEPGLAASLFQAALDNGSSPDDIPTPERLSLPRSFGAYELLEEAGRGGMGVVYRARQSALDRTVALKLLIAGPYSDEAALQRFQVEAKAAAAQQHPGIVAIHDCGTHDGQPFIAMDFIEGRNLAEACAGQPLEANRAARIMISIATAIQHAHEHGILHRDLKPSNVLLDRQDAPHITDFGLAGRIDGTNPITLTGQMLGSPSYTSPEQAAGRHDLTGVASDVYGLGALCYHLLTGRAPFIGPTPAYTLRLVLDSDPLSPAFLNPSLPGELATICLKCLAKEPARRYASAAELADDLTRYLTHQPIKARAPDGIYRFRKLVRRHRLPFAAAAAVLLTLTLGTTVSTWQAIRASRAETAESRLRMNEAALRRLAEEQTLAVRRQAYASDLNLAQQALTRDDLVRARELLNRHRPKAGEQDLRGWEWRYLWQLCRSDPSAILNDRPVLARQLAASPDGTWLATASYDDAAVEMWNLRTREHYAVPLPAGTPCAAIAFSPTQPLLAVHYPLGREISPGPARLVLWDYMQRQPAGEWSLEHRGPRRGSLAFSADGRKLLVGVGRDPSIWSVPEGTLLRALRKGDGDKMAAAPGFDVVAIEGPDGSVNLVDLDDGNQRVIPKAAKEYVSAYAFSHDGKILATAGSGAETSIRLWDVATGAPLGTLDGHHLPVEKIVFWPDGRTLASGSFDQTIRIWDLASQKNTGTLRGLDAELTDLILLPDGLTLASATLDRTVRLWPATAPTRINTKPQVLSPVMAWTFTREDGAVVTVDADGKVRRWHGSRYQNCEELVLPGLPPVAYRRWNPPLPQAAFVSADPPLGLTLTVDRDVVVWNWAQGTIDQRIHTSGRDEVVLSVVGLTAGNRHVLVNWINPKTKARGLAEWARSTGDMVRSWTYAHLEAADFPQSLVSADGRFALLAWCGNPFWDSSKNWGPVQLLDLEAGHARTLADTVFWWWQSAAFSADNRWLAIPHRSSTAIIEAPSFERAQSLAGGSCACFSPDGKRLALLTTGGTAPLHLFDTTNWETVLALDVPQGFLFSAGFSPDGNVLAMWSQFNKLVLWRAPSWAEIEAEESSSGRR